MVKSSEIRAQIDFHPKSFFTEFEKMTREKEIEIDLLQADA